MKFAVSLAAIVVAATSLNSFAEENKKGWEFLPGTHDGFIFNPTLSVMGGLADIEDVQGDVAFSWGLEASFNCPLIQPPTNKVRQQLSYFNYSDGKTTVQTAEINPHYVVEVKKHLWLGAGPGVGYVNAESANKTSNMLAVQLGASFHYNINKIFIGGEARVQFTQPDDVGNGKDNGAENWRTLLKIGYNI